MKPNFHFPPIFVTQDGTIMQQLRGQCYKPLTSDIRFTYSARGTTSRRRYDYSQFKTELAYERNPELFL